MEKIFRKFDTLSYTSKDAGLRGDYGKIIANCLGKCK